MATSDPLSTVYCTDEDIAVRAGGDFALLAMHWNRLAANTDGAISAGDWTLTSATSAFDTTNITSGKVVWLTKPVATFKGRGELFGVVSSTSTTITLRRLGMTAGAGLSPCSGDTTGIEFSVPTLAPQIEEASFDLNRRYTIDDSVLGRTAASIYDLRDLRQACVLTVLVWRLEAEIQDKSDAAWGIKLAGYRREREELLGRLQVRWGTRGDSVPPTTFFSTRIIR